MCAIAGFVGFEDKELIKKMCEIQAHRGPDDHGYYIDKNVSLGHRRLSIIDLKTGKQPIHNEDESIWVVYNGEIYNFKELREELEQKGHRFYTGTDTEVIVHMYEEDAEHCIDKFRGMFAFALWDSKNKKLILARDRLGIKPLYYYHDNGMLIFASELKAILQYSEFVREINLSAIDSFLSFRYIPAPDTIFSRVKKVLPGHFGIYHNGRFQTKEYWDVYFDEKREMSEGYYSKKLRQILEESVRLHMVSDVPVGAFLSGGMDSSAIVAFMTKTSDEPVETFSIGFGIDGYDELKYAKIIAEHFNTKHHEFLVEPTIIEILPEIVWQLDEPFADFTALPLYYVSKMARRYVKVVLSGEGGDEALGGYSWYLPKPTDTLSRYFQKFPRAIQNITLKTADLIPESERSDLFKKVLKLASLQDTDRSINRMSLLDDSIRNHLYSNDFIGEAKINVNEIPLAYIKKSNGTNFLNKLFYLDIKMFLADDILMYVDKMSMLNSLETRPPFLDHKLVEFLTTIPSHLKIKENVTKHIFRKAMRPLIPDEIIKRKKQGFNLPLHSWFQNELRGFPEQILLDNRTIQRKYFKTQYINRLLEKFKANNQKYVSHIARLIMLELWFRTYIDREDTSFPDVKIIS